MQFSEEQIKKAYTAKTVEELLETAKAEGLSLTEEDAAHYFKVLHADPADAECMEVSEKEQENVAGGSQCGSYPPPPKFFVNQRLRKIIHGKECVFLTIKRVCEYNPIQESYYYEYVYDGHNYITGSYLDNRSDFRYA